MNHGISHLGTSQANGCCCHGAAKNIGGGAAGFQNIGGNAINGRYAGNGNDLKSVVQQLTTVVSNLQRMLAYSGSNQNSQAYGAGAGTTQKSGGGGCGGKSQVDQLQQLVNKLDQTYNNQLGNTNSADSHSCNHSQGTGYGGQNSNISTLLKDILGLLRQLLSGMQDAGGHRAGSNANGVYNQIYSLINLVKQYAY